MSFHRIFQLYILCLAVLPLVSCEDNKKEGKTANTTEIATDSISSSEEKKAPPAKNTPTYPLLTNENVEAFLTQYGAENPETAIRIGTRFGDIDITLFEDTPLHRANFIYLVKRGYFDETFFSRVVPNFIIQGGNSDNFSTAKKRTNIGNTYQLPAEIVPGRNHTYGTVSGAKEYRENPDKKSHPFEFFIFLGPPSATGHLDGNYTIFGKVTDGMDVVEKISELPTDEGDWPLQNVYIDVSIRE
jgi:peptidylprolyl isomerase